jgi:hypothetical protein
MTIYYDILVGVLVVFCAWREYCNMVERRELYNRLMCRDAADYRALTGQAPKSRNPIRANLQRQFDAGVVENQD